MSDQEDYGQQKDNEESEQDDEANDEAEQLDEQLNEDQKDEEQRQDQNQKQSGQDAVNNIGYIKILCFLIALFELIFAEYLWNVCTVNGIEIYETWLGESILYFMFLTLILVIFCYYLIMTLNEDYIFRFQVLLLFYCILVIVFGIFALNSGRQVTDEKIQELWDKLSEITQSYFGDDISNLTEENQRNLIQVGIYHIISGIMIFLVIVQLNRLYDRLKDKDKDKPDIQKLLDEHINPGIYEDGMILINYRRKQKIKNQKKKKGILQNEISQQDKQRNANQQQQFQGNEFNQNRYQQSQLDRKRKLEPIPVSEKIQRNIAQRPII